MEQARAWGIRKNDAFRHQQNRRRYLCKHLRRKDACRECLGLDYVLRTMYRGARTRAKREAVPFTISLQDLYYLFGVGFCPALGEKFTWFGRTVQNSSPTLDRFEPSLGYTRENCFIISDLANKIKSNATQPEVQAVADWMKFIEDQKDGR